jgi:ankyrin repeat protein
MDDGEAPDLGDRLSKAVLDGDTATAIDLIVDGADPNRRDEYSGATVLAIAAMMGDARMIEALLAVPDLDVNATNVSGDTALHHAVNHGHADVVERLLNQPDVDVNATNSVGTTALIRSVDNGDEHIVGLILARPDVNVNLVDVHRSTPLHHAVAAGRTDLAALLLTRPDTNLDITNRPFRLTAFEIASQSGDQALIELLRDAAATHTYGDALSESDSYVEPAERGDEPTPRMPYDQEPWPRP